MQYTANYLNCEVAISRFSRRVIKLSNSGSLFTAKYQARLRLAQYFAVNSSPSSDNLILFIIIVFRYHWSSHSIKIGPVSSSEQLPSSAPDIRSSASSWSPPGSLSSRPYQTSQNRSWPLCSFLRPKTWLFLPKTILLWSKPPWV